jgi:hypothetical protein
MTPKTPQCEVFWALLSNFKHSGVPENSKSPTLEVLGFTPTLGQSGVATAGDPVVGILGLRNDSHLGVPRQNAIWMWPPWRAA